MKGLALERDQYRGFAVDLAVFFLLSFLVLIPFRGTIFEGIPVSKICLLKVMDAVQAPELCAPWSITDDLSTSMAHVPNEYFANSQKSSGDLPLWNPLNGGGRPFVAEFQTLPFSFFHQLFPANSEYLYNLGLVFKVFLSAAGTYFLARTCSLSRWSSVAAALAFALCPHCLRFNELVNNYCFYPWLSLAFVWFASKPNLLRATLAGLLTAATAYNMHPETFACGSVLAAALAGIKLLQQDVSRPGKNLLRTTLWLAFIAALAFCASAPVVLPLVEFISNGASYKFASHDIEHMQWFSYLLSMVLPAGSGSAYLGIVLGFALPLGLLVWAKRDSLMLALFVIVSLFSIRPLFLEQMLSVKPFAFLLPEYTLYAAILLACIGGATGLDELVQRKNVSTFWRRAATIFASVFAFVALAWQLPAVNAILPRLTSFYFETPQGLAFTIGSLVVLILCCVTAIFVTRLERFQLYLSSLLVLSNTILLITIVPAEMGPREHFQYQENEVTRYLQTLDGRIVATGYNIFQPNTNLIYGTSDFRSTAPLFPSRYTEFLKLGNAGAKFCTIPESPVVMNEIFDLASVKYVLSDRALESPTEALEARKSGQRASGEALGAPASSRHQKESLPTVSLPLKLADGLRLEEMKGSFDPDSDQYFVDAIFTVHKLAEGHYSAVLAATDGAGKVVQPIRWLNDRIEEVGTKCGEHLYRVHLNIAVADSSQSKSNLSSRVQPRLFVRDNWSAKVLETGKTADTAGILVRCSGSVAVKQSPNKRFKKIASLPGPLFVYENKNSFPRVYLTQEFKVVGNANESLVALGESLQSHTPLVTLVEDPSASLTLKSLPNPHVDPSSSNDISPDKARILDSSADSVLVFVNHTKPSLLVLNDTYYPDWIAEVDGKETKVYAANHMFRAIEVPAGKHFVVFSYRPHLFLLGCQLLGGSLAILFLIIAAQVFSLRRTNNGSTQSRSTLQNVASQS